MSPPVLRSTTGERDVDPARWPGVSVGFLVAMSLPGLVLLLVVVAAVEAFRNRRRDGELIPATGTGVQELEAFFSATKRAENETRASVSLMRDDEQETGAPPRVRIDLERGTATIADA
jgi:hypothetical protein